MRTYIDHPSPSRAIATLTDDQLRTLRIALETVVEEQRERLHRSDALFHSLASDDEADRNEREAARRAAEQAYDNLHDASRALERMSDGTYGLCAGCGRPIPFERLEALPQTRRCVGC